MYDSHTVYMQMTLLLHNDTTAVVERQINLPKWYQPQQGQWIYHNDLGGLAKIGPVIFDGTRDAFVPVLVGTAFDLSMNLDEWLAANPGWYGAKIPFVVLNKKKLEQDTDGNEP